LAGRPGPETEAGRALSSLEGFPAGPGGPGLKTSGEVLPSDLAPALIGLGGALAARAMFWGFPGFPAKSGPAAKPRPLINARAETAAGLPVWRESLARRRCLVPAAGFFEWGGRPRRKRLFGLPGADFFFLAGIWREFEEEGRLAPRFSVLTTAANESVAPVHDRMPVVVREAEAGAWLGPGWGSVLDRREVSLSSSEA
jgi:putative SOS response-associated peptidase YedK